MSTMLPTTNRSLKRKAPDDVDGAEDSAAGGAGAAAPKRRLIQDVAAVLRSRGMLAVDADEAEAALLDLGVPASARSASAAGHLATVSRLMSAGFASALVDVGALSEVLAAVELPDVSGPVAVAACECVNAALSEPLVASDEAVVVHILIRVFSMHPIQPDGVAAGCRVLRRLASERRMVIRLSLAIAFTAAVRALTPNAAVAREACACLAALVEVPANRSQLHPYGAAELLVGLMRAHSSNVDVLLFASRAVARLADSPGRCEALVRAGAAPLLASLAQRHAAGGRDASACCVTALRTLVALPAQPAAALERLLADGVPESLIAVARQDDVPVPTRAGCCSVLAAMGAHPALTAALLAADAIPALAAMLSEGQPQELVAAALAVLASMAGSDASHEALRLSEIPAAVTAAVHRLPGQLELVREGTRLLARLAGKHTNLVALRAAGAPATAILALQQHAADEDVACFGCEVLSSMLPGVEEAARTALRDGGVVAAISVAVAPHASVARVSAPGVNALRTLSTWYLTDQAGAGDAEHAAAARAALAVLAAHPSITVAEQCCAALNNITYAAKPNAASSLWAEPLSSTLLHQIFLALQRWGHTGNACASNACFALVHVSGVLGRQRLGTATMCAVVDVLWHQGLYHRSPALPDCATWFLLGCSLLPALAKAKRRAVVHAWGAGNALVRTVAALDDMSRESTRRNSLLLLEWLSEMPECSAGLRRTGAAGAAVSAAGSPAVNEDLSRQACSVLGRLCEPGASACTAGPSADGTACAAVLACMSRHPQSLNVAIAGTFALRCLAAAAPHGMLPHVTAVVAALKTTLSHHENADVVVAISTTINCLMQATAPDGGAVAARQQLVQLLIDKPALGAQLPHARLLLASHHGTDAELKAALAAVGQAPRVPWADCVEAAALAGRVAAVESLLAQCGEDLWATLPRAALCIAAQRGHLPLVEHLLGVWHARAAATGSFALWMAAEGGHLPVVERLLQEDGVSPAAGGGAPLWLAAREGHVHIVERLLADPRCEPAASDCAALRFAGRSGHAGIIERLLSDTRLGSDDLPPGILAEAVHSNEHAAMAVLLQDPRVDATVLTEELQLSRLPPSSRFVLLRQPSVLRVHVLSAAGAGAGAGIDADPEVEPIGHRFVAADVRAFSANAWRRRRAAVLAWGAELL